MTRLFAHANYDFIGFRRYAYGVTARSSWSPGLLFLLIAGLNYSIEFTGGTLVQIRSPRRWTSPRCAADSTPRASTAPRSRTSASPNEYVIRARVAKPGTDANDTQATASAVSHALDTVLGAKRTRSCGRRRSAPRWAASCRQKAFLAIFLSFFAVLAYLAYRFEWRFGLAAVIATAHDILATIAFIGVMRLEVSLTVVAAVLSMVGYSLNDTIIIFDRVRENLRKHKKEAFEDILNRSINETLPRSVLTHGTTLATLIALAVFGGEVIRPFALVMFFGVFTGTFSSIYIAAPVLMAIEKRWPGPAARGHLSRRRRRSRHRQP